MSSETAQTADPFYNNPWINRFAGYIGHLQERKFLTKERLKSLKHYFLFTIGFLVLLYFLVHIQIVFFWLLKFLFGLIFKLISLIFWLPLKTVRWFVPKTIDYDILFPLFWLCSIASFYASKHYHEQICQFYDRQLVRRFRTFTYDLHKRDEVRRYLFILTFIVLLLLQSLFILFPIAQSIKYHHAEAKKPSISLTEPTAKSAMKEAVETMSENLYHRFIDAFKDENETISDEKRQPLISDEQLEKTFKTIRKSFQREKEKIPEEKKIERSSRFQRWILHYLKAPFKKWTPPKEETNPSDSHVNQHEEENDDEDLPISSASLMTQIEDSDDEDEDIEIDEDTEESSIIPQPIKNVFNTVKKKFSSSDDDDDEENDDDDDDDETEPSSIKEVLSTRIKQMETIGEEVTKKLSSSKTDDDDDEHVSSIAQQIKETVTKQMENLQHKAEELFSKKTDEKKHAQTFTEKIGETVKKIFPSESLTDKIRHSLDDSVESVKHLGEKVTENLLHSSLSSSTSSDEEDSGYESDNEDDPSIIDRLDENLIKPASEAMHQIRDKISSFIETEEEKAKVWIDQTKHAAEKLAQPVKAKIASEVDHIHHKAEDLLDSAQTAATDTYEKSTEFIKEKASKIKGKLPKAEKILSNVKHDVVEPLEKKVKQAKKIITKKTEEVTDTIVDGVKSLKKTKKPKSLTEKTKDQVKKISKTIREKIPGQKKKNKKKTLKMIELVREQSLKKLNGWFDEAWNVWHLTVKNIAHLFIPSTRYAQHLPRYNTTSIYTAYTDVKCYDYTKKRQLYRISKHPHLSFLDSYRVHSPFPVYLSVLKSNGPRCYRQYPDSSCGVMLKSLKRNFLNQLYRFLRLWIIFGIILAIGAVLYQRFLQSKRQHHSPPNSSNRSPPKVQIVDNRLPSQPTTRPLNEQVYEQLSRWLNRQQNDGYQRLSETCRDAINQTFLKQLERHSVETLQFINAKISDVSQNQPLPQNNQSKTNEISADRLVINAVLEIDHLILNMINIFTEHHFSFETQKLTGKLYVLLVVNPTQYAIEASLKELHLSSSTIIDRTNKLTNQEKTSMSHLIEDIIQRTSVRCNFRLADNHENDTSIGSSSFDSNRMYSSSNQTTPQTPTTTTTSVGAGTKSALETTALTSLPRSRPITPNIYPPRESPPTLLINDHQTTLYNSEAQRTFEPKQIIIQIVKAVQLHNVEQPYCILELDHPKQIQQSNIARNGLNPFWDERFLFECDDQTSLLHIQIIDRRYPNPKLPDSYVDTIYADLTIPFSYVANRVYKQDVQINPEHPESILRLEFSTLSEEEALAANNGYDVESLTDSQTWPYSEREGKSIDQNYGQAYASSALNAYIPSRFENETMAKPYGLTTNAYELERDYASTLPRTIGLHSPGTSYSPSSPRDGTNINEKPQKPKSFMNSLKHLTLPRRKNRKDKTNDESMSSQASSTSQLNATVPSPMTNLASHNSSSEYYLSKTTDGTPIRRSRSISQSFKNLFRSNSRKRGKTTKSDASNDFNHGTQNILGDNRENYLATSTPTTKKLSFLSRRKSKSKTKQSMDFSTNSLSSHDHSRMESVRDTPVRANGGQPVIMSKSALR